MNVATEFAATAIISFETLNKTVLLTYFPESVSKIRPEKGN